MMMQPLKVGQQALGTVLQFGIRHGLEQSPANDPLCPPHAHHAIHISVGGLEQVQVLGEVSVIPGLVWVRHQHVLHGDVWVLTQTTPGPGLVRVRQHVLQGDVWVRTQSTPVPGLVRVRQHVLQGDVWVLTQSTPVPGLVRQHIMHGDAGVEVPGPLLLGMRQHVLHGHAGVCQHILHGDAGVSAHIQPVPPGQVGMVQHVPKLDVPSFRWVRED